MTVPGHGSVYGSSGDGMKLVTLTQGSHLTRFAPEMNHLIGNDYQRVKIPGKQQRHQLTQRVLSKFSKLEALRGIRRCAPTRYGIFSLPAEAIRSILSRGHNRW